MLLFQVIYIDDPCIEIWYVDGGAIKHMSYICEFLYKLHIYSRHLASNSCQ